MVAVFRQATADQRTERPRQKIERPLTVDRHERVNVDDTSNPIAEAVRSGGHRHPAIARATEHDVVEPFELHDGDDVFDVCGEAHPLSPGKV